MKRIITLSSFLLTFSALVAAGPESFDYLADYKLPAVTKSGPAKEIIQFHEKIAQSAHAVHSYDADRRLVKTSYFKNNKPDGHVMFFYDKSVLAKEVTFDSAEKPLETITYQRDKAGKLLSYTAETSDGEKILWKFQYANGQKPQTGQRYINKELTESFSMKGNLQIIKNAKGEKTAEILAFAQNGLVTQRIRTDATGTRKIEYAYDKQGRISSMTFYETRRSELIKVKSHHFEYLSLNSLK